MNNKMKMFFFFLVSVLMVACNEVQQPDANAGALDKDSGKNSEDWKIGVQMWTFNHFTFLQALDKADSAGVKHIEAYWGQPLGGDMKDSFGINMSDQSKAKIKDLLAKKGLNIVAMGVVSSGKKEDWLKAFGLAKEFNLSYITAEIKQDLWPMVDSLCGAYNIKIAMHDHPRPSHFWHPDSVLAATNTYPNLGACADLGHWARSGLDPVDCLKKLKGHIYGVHLKDIKQFGNVKADDVPVGKGVLNYPAIFAELKSQDFKGMFSIEQESNWLNSLPEVQHTVKYYDSLTLTLNK